MEILDNIIKLLKQSKKSQKELMHYLGVNPNVFSDWKAGRNQSYMKYLPKIAEYFNVSIDTLTGQKNTPSPTDEEEAGRLFELYEKADAKTRKAVELLLGFRSED